MFLNDITFGFEERGISRGLKPTINCIAPLVAAAGITAAAGIFGALASDDGPDYPEPEILPKTVSGNTMQDLDFLFDVEATENMKKMTDQLTEWGEADRSFFESQFQPFQQDLIGTNQSLLPMIERNSTEALNQNVKDLLSSESLKSSFRQNVTNMGTDIGSLASNFAQQIDAIPGPDQRISEAIAGVEKTFGQAGVELKRAMNAKGLGVSEASTRDLLLSKAEAKAGASDTAAEAARREKLQATAEGVGVLSGAQTGQTNQLLGQQASTQTGATLLPQVGGVSQLESVSKAGELAAGLTQSAAEKVLGQTSEVKSAEFTQKGIQDPLFMSKTTSNPVTSTGTEYVAPKPKAKPRSRSVAPAASYFQESYDTGADTPGGIGVGASDGGMTGGAGGVGVGAVGSAGSGGQGGADADGGTGGPSR